jgi:hypothetical protein
VTSFAREAVVATIVPVGVKATVGGLVALALCAGCGGSERGARRDAGAAPGGGAQALPNTVPRSPAGIDPRVAIEHGLIPTPIGRGPEFRPAARIPASGCARGTLSGRYRAHVEVFGRRQAVVIPSGIGVGEDARHEYGRLVDADCRAAARTLDPSGVVHFDREDLRLGDLFAVWGQPLDRARLLSFRGEVSAFVGGRRVAGDPAQISLRDGAQIVIESGGYIPPHPSFRFPPRPEP